MPVEAILVPFEERQATGGNAALGWSTWPVSSIAVGRTRDFGKDQPYNSPVLLYTLPIPPGSRIAHAALRVKPVETQTYDGTGFRASLMKRDGVWDARTLQREVFEGTIVTGGNTLGQPAGWMWTTGNMFNSQTVIQWRNDEPASWSQHAWQPIEILRTDTLTGGDVNIFYTERDGSAATVTPHDDIEFIITAYDVPSDDITSPGLLDRLGDVLFTDIRKLKDMNWSAIVDQYFPTPTGYTAGDTAVLHFELTNAHLLDSNHQCAMFGFARNVGVDGDSASLGQNVIFDHIQPGGILRRPAYTYQSFLPCPTGWQVDTDDGANIHASSAIFTPDPFVTDVAQIWGSAEYSPDVEVDLVTMLQAWVDDPSYKRHDTICLALHAVGANIAVNDQNISLYATPDAVEPGIELLVCYEPWKASDADPASPWATADADPASPWATADADPASPWAASDADPSTPWTKTDVEDC